MNPFFTAIPVQQLYLMAWLYTLYSAPSNKATLSLIFPVFIKKFSRLRQGRQLVQLAEQWTLKVNFRESQLWESLLNSQIGRAPHRPPSPHWGCSQSSDPQISTRQLSGQINDNVILTNKHCQTSVTAVLPLSTSNSPHTHITRSMFCSEFMFRECRTRLIL